MQARMEAELGQQTENPESGREEKSKKGLITRMILDLEKQRREDDKLCEELLQCPEEGFHGSDPKADVECEPGDEAAPEPPAAGRHAGPGARPEADTRAAPGPPHVA